MNIKPTDSTNGLAAYKNQAAIPAKKIDMQAKRSMRPDEFVSSSQNAERQGNGWQAGDVRQGLVTDLRERIRSGDYQVNSYDLASRIVEVYKGGL